jgi:hypothetical protein
MNDAGLGILRESIASASDDARRILAGTASDSSNENLLCPDCANATAIGVVLPCLRVRANILTQLTTDAQLGIARDIFIL